MSRPGAGHDGPDDALVEALRRLLQSRLGRGVRRIDTHVSWVLLDGEHAWKIKKPVRLGFLDFSRIDVRRRCCEEELRLNRRLAPSIYLDVLPVRGSVASPLLAGAPDRDGQRDGEAIEYVLRMKQFAPGSLLSERLAAGRLLPDTIDRLARRLADFQAAAPQAPADSDFGSAALVRATTTGVLDGIASQAQAPRAEGLRDWCESRATDLASCFESRKARGRVREGHGDLHLSNLVVLEDEVTAFDCIEFDPGLRWIDVVCDIAFITMDLRAHGRRDLAFRFLDRWLEAGGDHGGLAVLRYYEVYRALVRALVAGIRRAQDDAPSRATGASGPGHEPDYLGAAQDLARECGSRLLITHGLSGSGKSFVSAQLLEQAGAIRLRSDVERKRLFGLAALERSEPHARDTVYGPDATRRTYAQLRDAARIALQAGYPVIVDAAFLRAAERDDFRALARELRVPFGILDCRAEPALLRERVRARSARGDDASEADIAVLERQLETHEGLRPDELACAIGVEGALPPDAAALARRWLDSDTVPAGHQAGDGPFSPAAPRRP